MIDRAQRVAASIGTYGCYFLALVKIAEDLAGIELDVLREYANARKTGFVGEDAFVLDAGKLFTMLTHGGASYEVWKAGPGHSLPLDYKLLPGEREVLRFEYTDANAKPWVHFVVGDGSGQCAYDPEGDSNSVARGKVVSRRIVRSI
jgi:hypothetical protein